MSEYSRKLQHPDWQKKKYEIYERDKFTCRKCLSIDKQLVAHHLKYEFGKEPWDYPNEFFKTLCKDDHEAEHECKKLFNNLIVETLKKEFYYEDLLDISCLILKMFQDRQSYNYFYSKLDKLVTEIDQDLSL